MHYVEFCFPTNKKHVPLPKISSVCQFVSLSGRQEGRISRFGRVDDAGLDRAGSRRAEQGRRPT